MRNYGRGHMVGRGCVIPQTTRRQIYWLYCQREVDEKYLYSIDEIAEELKIDTKSVRTILRDEMVRLLSTYSLKGL